MSKLKVYAGLFVAGLILGIILSSFFISGSSHPVRTIIQPAVLVRDVRAAEIASNHRLDSLQGVNKRLTGQLQVSTGQLQVAKKKTAGLQAQIYDLIDRTATAEDKRDTGQIVSNCDQLKDTVSAFIIASAQKDSFYDATTLFLEEQLHNREATITEQSLQYQSLKASFDKSVSGLQQANEQNKRLAKQFRRQKFKSTLKTIGIIVATAFTTHYLSQH